MRSIRTISGENIAQKACTAFFMEIKKLLQNNKEIIVSLPGGRSIQDFFKRIPLHKDMLAKEEWQRLHFFWTDERLVPPDDKESNYKLAKDLFLQKLLDENIIPEKNIHRFKGEYDPEIETDAYTKELAAHGGKIHILILGVGPDGHIGALFSKHAAMEEDKPRYIFLEDCPKPPSRRMTLSPQQVIQSGIPFVFFISEEKRDAYDKFKDDSVDFPELPCKLVLKGDSKSVVYVVTDLEIS